MVVVVVRPERVYRRQPVGSHAKYKLVHQRRLERDIGPAAVPGRIKLDGVDLDRVDDFTAVVARAASRSASRAWTTEREPGSVARRGTVLKVRGFRTDSKIGSRSCRCGWISQVSSNLYMGSRSTHEIRHQ
jgi:hypothetical protein